MINGLEMHCSGLRQSASVFTSKSMTSSHKQLVHLITLAWFTAFARSFFCSAEAGSTLSLASHNSSSKPRNFFFIFSAATQFNQFDQEKLINGFISSDFVIVHDRSEKLKKITKQWTARGSYASLGKRVHFGLKLIVFCASENCMQNHTKKKDQKEKAIVSRMKFKTQVKCERNVCFS